MESNSTQWNSKIYSRNLAFEGAVGSSSRAEGFGKELAGADPALCQWYETAYQYYNAVTSGSEAKPSATEWNEFLNQMNWAYGQLQGAWNPGESSGDFQALPDASSGTEQDPFGGITGPHGNLIYNRESVRVGFVGQSKVSDIWGNDVNIDVAPLSATVTSETTLDTRTQPPEQVIRVIVKDAATGQESVYMIHDYADAKIQINTPKESQLLSKTASITWGAFQENVGGDSQETEAVGTKNDKGEWEYVGNNADEYLDFSPKNGADETHLVWSNARVQLGNADHASVQKNADGTLTLLVTHQDKSTDTFQIQKGYKLELRGQTEYVSFAGAAEGAAMPADYADRIALNASSKSSDAPSAGKNPKPDSVDSGAATYNTQADVELHAFEDPAIDFYKIYAPGTVTIHTANYADKVEVRPVGKLPDATYMVVVTDAKTGNEQDYAIYGNPEKIVIDGMDVKLRDSAALDSTIEITGKNASDRDANLLSSLMELTGKTEKQVLNALKASFPTDCTGAALDTDEKIKTAIANGTLLPAKPNKALLQLLRILDDKFSTELSKATIYSHSVLGPAYKAATERLVELLKAIYPDHMVSAARTETTDGYATQWPDFNDIMFDGAKYSYTDESTGNTSNLTDWA